MNKLTMLGVFGALSVCCATASAAAPPVYSQVSSFADAGADSKKSYVLAHEKDRSIESTFEYKEFSQYVKKALLFNGFKEAANAETADVVIFFGYGIGDPKSVAVNYSIPMFGQTGIASAYTTGSSYGNSYNASTTFTPSYGITGVINKTATVTTYQRWLRLSGVDPQSLRSPSTPTEMWKVEVKSEGISGDLRYILPFMAYSSRNYIALSSGKQVEVKTKEKNKDFRKFLSADR